MFTIELVKEAELTRREFFDFLSQELPENQTNDSFSGHSFDGIHLPVATLELIRDKSGEALKQCENLVLLDKKLKSIAVTKAIITSLNSLKILSDKLKIFKNFDLKELILLVKEWKNVSLNFQKESGDLNLKSNDNVNIHFGFDFDEINTIIATEIPNLIGTKIDKILSNWTDDKFDEENGRIIGFMAGTSNPLLHLFVSFPRNEIFKNLQYYRDIGEERSLYYTYPDRLLSRLYDVLGSSSSSSTTVPTSSKNINKDDFPFSVGYLEDLTPPSMKYATRVTCILESVKYLIKLHENISFLESSKIKEKLLFKCCQIVRQLRKNAEVERSYHKVDPNVSPSLLDSRLNEICTIKNQLRAHSVDFYNNNNVKENIELGLEGEVEKWKIICEKLEELYLLRGIKVAIEMDKIVSLNDSDFPVSSCIDDIFYVLKSTKTRNPMNTQILNMAFCEHFLKVIRNHLEILLEAIKKVNITVKLSRELVSFIVLINNLIVSKSYWKALNGDQNIIDCNIKDLLEFGLRQGIYKTVLYPNIKMELSTGRNGEDLFKIIRKLIQNFIMNIFTKVLAKEAIEQLIILLIGDFVQAYCKLMLYDTSSSSGTGTGSQSMSSTTALKHDRELHDLTNWLEDQLNLEESQSHTFNKSIDDVLGRIKQSIALSLCENKIEAQELVELYKRENNCKLRAGEILVILNKKS